MLDLRKIAVQLLQQEQQNRCVCLLIDCTAFMHFLILKMKFFSVFKKLSFGHRNLSKILTSLQLYLMLLFFLHLPHAPFHHFSLFLHASPH